jgi:hypothetical protein
VARLNLPRVLVSLFAVYWLVWVMLSPYLLLLLSLLPTE